MNDFHKKIVEARVKQKNIKWLGKEIALGLFIGLIVIIVFGAMNK